MHKPFIVASMVSQLPWGKKPLEEWAERTILPVHVQEFFGPLPATSQRVIHVIDELSRDTSSWTIKHNK